MNPAGIVFGQNFSLNIPASFTATTANGIAFGNNWMNATGPNNYALFPGEPTALGFTMTQPAGIINAGTIQVANNQAVSLFAGTVISNGLINAPTGAITTASVTGNQTIRLQVPGSLLGFEVQTASGILPADLPLCQPIYPH
ncbi:MAG: filamentous hemagglutinin N-terminal domain-containing protein [Alkalinema sp. RL_2_19]|nr:filamentous hemagglutinin N-terminal domain-containing protein [Alkalinema sp. RL_2_19]